MVGTTWKSPAGGERRERAVEIPVGRRRRRRSGWPRAVPPRPPRARHGTRLPRKVPVAAVGGEGAAATSLRIYIRSRSAGTGLSFHSHPCARVTRAALAAHTPPVDVNILVIVSGSQPPAVLATNRGLVFRFLFSCPAPKKKKTQQKSEEVPKEPRRRVPSVVDSESRSNKKRQRNLPVSCVFTRHSRTTRGRLENRTKRN